MTVVGQSLLCLPLVILVVVLSLREAIPIEIVHYQGVVETALSLLLLNTKVHYFKFKILSLNQFKYLYSN